MKTVEFIIPQLLTEETECHVEKICFFRWHFGKKMHGLRLQTDVYLIYRSQNYKQFYFSVYINVPQTADVGIGGIRPIGKRGLDDICTPGAAISCCLTQHGEMLRVVVLWATDRQTPSPSPVKHIMTLIIRTRTRLHASVGGVCAKTRI